MAKKRLSKQDKEHIRAAAANIPDLLAKETRAHTHKKVPYHSAHYQKRKKLMLFAVLILSIGLLGIWGLSMQSKFYDYKTADKTEKAMFDEARKDIGEIFATLQEQDAAKEAAAAAASSSVQAVVTSTPATSTKNISSFFSDVAAAITSTTATSTKKTSTTTVE